MASSETHQLLDPLFNELKDGFCLSSGRVGLIYLNPAAQRLLETDAEKASGQLICELLCSRLAGERGGARAAACPLRLGEAKSATVQGRFGPHDVRVHCQRLETTLFDSWEPEKWLTIIEDAGAELLLERLKEDWRNMVAHDLRSPLTNVFGTLRILEESAAHERLSREEAGLLSTSIRAARRMLDLLNLYLDVAKLDAGQMPIKLATVDLADLTASIVEEQQVALREKSVKLAVSVFPGLKARADEALLFRVVQNLLANAIKFVPREGHIAVWARREPPRLELEIRDDGPGIAPADLPLLFQRYFQTAAGQGRNLQGTGLGLAFCREAARAMGGDIRVVSEPGKGSAFILALPEADARA